MSIYPRCGHLRGDQRNKTFATVQVGLRRVALFAFACLVASPLVCVADPVPSGGGVEQARFSWDAVANPAVSGYKVHWGTTSGVYTGMLDAGNATEVIISEFSQGVEYFSAITAYSNTGGESNYSVEIAFTVPSTGGTTTPVITAPPTATAITYGQTLANSSLSGGAASVPGAFAFSAPATVPAAGTASQTVTFTPTDTSNYQTVATSVTVTVAKAVPLITAQPTATDITYGQTLASSTLSGGVASVPGSFGFTPSGTDPVPGGTLRLARFSWDAVANPSVSGYKVHWGTQSGVYDHSFDAGNVTEVIISGFAKGIGYFSAITAYSNTGGESDYSTEIAFTIPDTGGTLTLPVGMSSQSVTFTPTDTNNYQTATTSVSVTVLKPTPLITAPPTATSIIYGQTLASSTLSGGVASVPGAFAFSAPATVPAAGSASQTVTFTPTDTSNYQTVATSVTVTVAKAVPLITAQPTATDITYGQTLAGSTLSGGVASVPGSFGFTPSGTDPVPGGTLRLARFRWDTVANPMVSGYKVHWGTQSGVYDHSYDAGNVAEVIISGFAEGIGYFSAITAYSNTGEESGYSAEIAFTIPDTGGMTTLPVGTSSQSVTFTPIDTSNYQTVTTSVSVTVNAATFQAIAQESLESWRVRCFSAEQSAAGQATDDADPDHDGLVNLAEYALGTDPHGFTPPMTAGLNSDGLVLTFYRPSGLTNVEYAAVSSDDLIHWNPCFLEVVVDGPVQTMRAVDPLTSGDPARRFISLRFTKF